MSGQPDDSQLADSSLLSRWVSELAARELSSLGDDYRLTTLDHGGSVVALGERDRPPHRYVAIWKATVEGLRASREGGTPLERHVSSTTITGDDAPLLLQGLRRVFPGLFGTQ